MGELLTLLSIVGLVTSGALAGGVFLYKEYMQTNLQQKTGDLQRMEAQFEPSLIDQLTKLDKRMHSAQSVLSAHMAMSVFFQTLEALTLTTISFQDLHVDASDPQHISVEMKGVAQSINSIALQAQTFSKSDIITDPIFSAIVREQDGIHFDFTATINPVPLNYAQLANGATAAAQAPAASQQPQAPASVFSNGGSNSAPGADANGAQQQSSTDTAPAQQQSATDGASTQQAPAASQ